ncbi:MAG: SDR family oxidoreductase [Candidatus Hydrogenedens sp.]|nr:SDR family oxidoreductase [Candidatus Hydrogenedens sp.]
MSSLMDGQVVIITGSGRGIGAAAGRLFAKHGAKVVLTDIDAGPVGDVAAEIRASGGDAISVPGDLTAPEFPRELVENTIEKYGQLNVLVNNAGYTWDGMAHKMSDKQWQAMLDVHLTAPFRLIQAAAPYMRDAAKREMDEGRAPEPRCIVNVSSTSGLHGNIGQANYAAAKMGIVGLTKTIAKEWGSFGIRCNAVAFGMIETRLTQDKTTAGAIEVAGETIQLGIPGHIRDLSKMAIPLGRSGTPEEAAGALLMVASPLAAYVTGHTLEATGGLGI